MKDQTTIKVTKDMWAEMVKVKLDENNVNVDSNMLYVDDCNVLVESV